MNCCIDINRCSNIHINSFTKQKLTVSGGPFPGAHSDFKPTKSRRNRQKYKQTDRENVYTQLKTQYIISLPRQIFTVQLMDS